MKTSVPYYIPIFLLILAIFSCQKESEEHISCKTQTITEFYADTSNAVIPLASENTWVYVDSIWSLENPDSFLVKTTELFIEEVRYFDGAYTFDFNQMIRVYQKKRDFV